MNGLKVIQLGRMRYAEALDVQRMHLAEVLANREAGKAGNGVGRILLVEHEPVITLSRRAQSSGNLRASEDQLKAAGVEVALTDRGGDITYHGPGQLVVYPILDLNALNLRLIDYIRLLESVIIETLTSFDINAHTEPGATGVWVGEKVAQRRSDEAEKSRSDAPPPPPSPSGNGAGEVPSPRGGGGLRCTHEMKETNPPPLPQCLVPSAQCLPHGEMGPGEMGSGEMGSGEMGAKIAAIGVRVQRWVSMHGFALNVDPNLAHFDLIVPCGLAGRAVTSMKETLAEKCPSIDEVSARVVEVIEARIGR